MIKWVQQHSNGEGMMRCYPFAVGRLLAAMGGEWLSRENSIICEFKRSRASRIAMTQVLFAIKDCFRGRNERETF